MSNFVNVLLDMSLVGTYCILIVLLLRLLLRKAPRIFSYLLWGVVFLRLALPVFPEAPVSLVPQAVRSNPVTSYFTADEDAGLLNLVATDPVAGNPPTQDADENSPELVQATQENQSTATAPSNWTETVLSDLTSRNNLGQAVFIVWCTGIVLLASYNLVAYLRLRRRLTDAVLEDGVYITDRISSPFVLGLLRPRIYLPAGLSTEERSYVVLHEKSHLRRRDPLIKLLAFLITCLHWFNPFAWIAFLLFSRDIETTCDESVVRHLSDSSRKNYSTTLLAVASGQNILRPMPLAFGEGDLKGRIRSILNYKKPAVWFIGVAVVAVVATSIGLLMNPMSNESTNLGTVTGSNTSSIYSDTSLPAPVDETADTTVATSETVGYILNELAEGADSERTSWLNNWAAKTPVNPDNFSEIFAKYNYTLSQIAIDDDPNKIYQATGIDGTSVVRCTVFSDTMQAYQAMDTYMIDVYKDFREIAADAAYDGSYPYRGAMENYICVFDLPHMTTSSVFRGAYLSGNVFLEVNIPIQMDALIPFTHAVQEYGLGNPSINLDEQIPELPETATLCTPQMFLDILSEQGLEASKMNSDDEIYTAQSTDLNVQITLRPIAESSNQMDMIYLSNLYDGYAQTLSYRETSSYRCLIVGSSNPGEYVILFENNGWELCIAVFWNPDIPENGTSQRALAEDLLKKLCFTDQQM